jgi:cob(I)alamin adenosyltransferase
MRIYTKTGDKGQTSLLTGTRVLKNHPRIEAYGTVDELNSFIGLLRTFETDSDADELLFEVQKKLFVIGSLLANDDKEGKFDLNKITVEDIQVLEAAMDKMMAVLPSLKSFILPGGSPAVAYCHICRTICRRAERNCINLFESDTIDSIIIIYLNRLSDYFFMLARKIAYDRGIEMPVWKGK